VHLERSGNFRLKRSERERLLALCSVLFWLVSLAGLALGLSVLNGCTSSAEVRLFSRQTGQIFFCVQVGVEYA